MQGLDLDVVRHALTVARRRGFAEVELAIGDETFHARLDPAPPGAVPAAVEPGEPPLAVITSTLVGYYREAKTPLAVGNVIEKGDVVAVVAALGIANDIEAKVAGEVVEVLIEPDQPVEFGQVLAKVRP